MLVVDDSALVRRVIGRIIEGDDAMRPAAAASSAAAAKTQARQKAIDVITLDLELPDTDGLCLLKSFLTPPEGGQAHGVVVVSGNSHKHEAALALGATACFEKVHLLEQQEEFLDAIRRAANHHQ